MKWATITHGLKKLVDFPPGLIWIMVVDGKFYQDGAWQAYESRQPGSISAVLNGFLTALEKIVVNSELTEADFREIHGVALHNVENTQLVHKPGEYRHTDAQFLVEPDWASVDGIQNFLEFNRTKEQEQTHLHRPRLETFTVSTNVDSFLPSLEEIKNANLYFKTRSEILSIVSEVNQLEKIQNKEISKKYKTLLFYVAYPSEKLAHVAKGSLSHLTTAIKQGSDSSSFFEVSLLIVQMLTRLHAFTDGNNRVVVNAILNALLVFSGRAVAIYRDPNVFELHTIDELIEIVEQAIARTDDLLTEHSTLPFHALSPSLEDKQAFKPIQSSFDKKLFNDIHNIAKQAIKKIKVMWPTNVMNIALKSLSEMMIRYFLNNKNIV